jgi:hypothetical protein
MAGAGFDGELVGEAELRYAGSCRRGGSGTSIFFVGALTLVVVHGEGAKADYKNDCERMRSEEEENV